MLRDLLKSAAGLVRNLVRPHAALVAENHFLRQQLIVLQRRTPRPRLKRWDRVVLAGLTKLFPKLVDAVVIVKPKTVLGWHRSMWRWSWWRRSGRPTGRPPIDADLRALIRKMWRENRTWGEDLIAAELAKLGHHVSPRTVAKYRPPNVSRGNGQKWSTFIRNHLHEAWACDWFTIVTWCFRVIYGWVIMDLGRRRIVDVGATSAPSSSYAAQRFVQAVTENGNRAPRLLIRDRDAIYGEEFNRRVRNCGTRWVVGPPRSPKANAFCERVVGTLRRDCLDHILARDEFHATDCCGSTLLTTTVVRTEGCRCRRPSVLGGSHRPVRHLLPEFARSPS